MWSVFNDLMGVMYSKFASCVGIICHQSFTIPFTCKSIAKAELTEQSGKFISNVHTLRQKYIGIPSSFFVRF